MDEIEVDKWIAYARKYIPGIDNVLDENPGVDEYRKALAMMVKKAEKARYEGESE